MEFISELDLADFEDDESTHETRVGILIGVDYCFNFFLGKILKTSEGLSFSVHNTISLHVMNKYV